MNIKKAMILCAGFGKRLLPLTNEKPKPLLSIGSKLLIDYSISFLHKIGIEEILINTHHLHDKFEDFKKERETNIEISHEKKLLDTGGGIKKALSFFQGNNFVVLNSDTIWQKDFLKDFINLEKEFHSKKAKCALLLCKKEKSFDTDLKGDFNINEKNELSRSKNFIFTGCQILSPDVFDFVKKDIFSINEIWDNCIDKKNIVGVVSNANFFHATNLKIYEQLKDKNFEI
tara:strand:+ start:350 stop:1039 length:690 start_codon:yes stop_codon:yes gene_type:complete